VKYYYNYDDEYHHVYETISYSCGYCSEPLGFDDDWYYEYHYFYQDSLCAAYGCGHTCNHNSGYDDIYYMCNTCGEQCSHDTNLGMCSICEFIFMSPTDVTKYAGYMSNWLLGNSMYDPNAGPDGNKSAMRIMAEAKCKMEMLKDKYRGGGTLAIFAGFNGYVADHAWLEYTTNKGELYTIETWASSEVCFTEGQSNVHGTGFYGIVYLTGASTSMSVNANQVHDLLDSIETYPSHYQYGQYMNCAYFAIRAWKTAGDTFMSYNGSQVLALFNAIKQYPGHVEYT